MSRLNEIERTFRIRVENFIGYASVISNRLKEMNFIQHILLKEITTRSELKFFGVFALNLLTKDTKKRFADKEQQLGSCFIYTFREFSVEQ